MLLKNGHLIDPTTKTNEFMDIRIENGIITKIAKDLTSETDEEILDLSGLTIAPGLIDTHVHFRDPGLTYKEDIHTGSLAAAKGGFTSVICMANTKPTVDSVDTLSDILNRAKVENIHIYQTASVSYGLNGEKMTDFDALADAGACGFTDDGIPLTDAGFIKKAMEEAAKMDMPISLHEEDPALNEVNGVNKGVISKKMGIGGAPAISEDVMVARDVMLALDTGAKVDIQHISSGRSVDLVRYAKKRGAKVFAEATPHHFTLTEEDVLNYETMAKMNPPLRTEWDRTKIIEGLADGTIDMIATDHAPHSIEEKEREFTKAPSGIIGLETSLSLGITSLVKRGYLTMMQLLEKMTVNPAKLYNFECGTLKEGAAADIVIFAPDEVRTVESFESKAENSPFLGAQLYGKVKYTICDGKVVYRG